MTLYRKYRPQKIAELDLEDIRERLTKVLSSSYTPHAFLFSGPKGTGKTSAARIIAKALNCEKKILSHESRIREGKGGAEKSATHNLQPTSYYEIEPCDKCETCLSIKEGRHLDVLEIDAASNRGVEEIRELREKIKLAPVSAKMKVYIIDEVHMLTQEAFNALLKTLEEPPAHAVFILATTEVDRLPHTVTSRCIQFNFRKASPEEIVHCLTRVAKGEKIKVSDGFLKMIALSSDGSFRDATKTLEQAIIEKALDEDKLKFLLGRGSLLKAEEFLKMLSKRNVQNLIDEMEKMTEMGGNIRFFVEDILKILHRLLLSAHDIKDNSLDEDLKNLFDKKEVLSLIKLFSQVYIDLKGTAYPHLPLEVAIVEWCEGGTKNKI